MNRLLPGSFTRILWLALFVMLICQPVSAQPEPSDPQTPDRPVRAPLEVRTPLPAEIPERQLSTAGVGLKAVVFVGPIDGENGSWTLDEIHNAQQTAGALRSYGVTVYEYYPNQANGTWANIKAASNGAHFIIYRGHGVYWSSMPKPNVGGFALKDTFVSNEMIRSELHPADNFIVMLYGCFTAGSSSNDEQSINADEARRRVAMYSDPFFDIGAGGYYADWFGDAFTSYVHTLFQGGTQRAAYENFYDYDSSRMWRGTHPDHPSQVLWLGWDNWYAPLPNWNNAFAGQPEATLTDLFETRMLVSSHHVVYMAEPDDPIREYTVTITSSSENNFDWTADVGTLPPWLTMVGPTSGVSGQALVFQIDPSAAVSDDEAIILVETDTLNVGDHTQQITVSINLEDEVMHFFMPDIMR